MSARDEILARVRAGLAKGAAGTRRSAALAHLQAAAPGPLPTLRGDLVTRFCDKAGSLASMVERVADYAAVPARVAAYLAGAVSAGAGGDRARRRRPSTGPPPALPATAAARADADPVGITGCFCAIAETGTLLLLSGPATPASVSLLPETHIALVPAARVVATMEDAFALLHRERGQLPRAANFVSGPSRTGDIEQNPSSLAPTGRAGCT